MADGRKSRNSNKTEITPSANAIFHPGSSKTPEQAAREAREDRLRERSRRAVQNSVASTDEPEKPKRVTLTRPTKPTASSENIRNQREGAMLTFSEES